MHPGGAPKALEAICPQAAEMTMARQRFVQLFLSNPLPFRVFPVESCLVAYTKPRRCSPFVMRVDQKRGVDSAMSPARIPGRLGDVCSRKRSSAASDNGLP
jgi:hypothetical protein